MIRVRQLIAYPFLVIAAAILIGCGASTSVTTQPSGLQQGVNLDTVKAGRFDTGKMWTFENPPVDYFQEAYAFRPSEQWLENARLGAIRFASWCSSSFVSADGLVMTNHHCGRGPIEQVSKEGENLLTNGFYARTPAEERKVDGLYVDQLVKIDDVTAEVQAAIDKGKSDEEKNDNKRKAIMEIEARAGKESGLQCSVVTMYNGGKYSLYSYKRYDDVRLVFAPELQLGFFGGDPDNFTYPRYDLDCSFFRVYQDSVTPLKTTHYFPFSKNGAKAGEPVFVIGNPGRTTRLNTVAQLEYTRDIRYPLTVKMLANRADILQKQMKEHPDRKEELLNQYFGITNSLKAISGQLDGLRDPVLMARKRDFEKKFRAAVDAKPELKAKYGAIWDNIAECRNMTRKISPELNTFGFTMGLRSALLGFASRAVDYANQLSLPDEERDKPNRGNGITMLKSRIARSVGRVDVKNEIQYLTAQLQEAAAMLGADDPFVKKALAGRSYSDAAAALINGSALKDSASRVQLLDGGASAINSSTDPLVELAREAAPRYRKAQAALKEYSAREEANVNLLGQALFSVYGTSIPPDATFTLRLADGVVKGYDYNGTTAPAFTTFYGMYDRYYSNPGDENWDLPERWKNLPKDFDLSTPVNFVSTCDIIGGNSGSPVVNKDLQIVGLVFDGNMESLPGDFIFTEEKNRTVAVHSSGLMEAFKHIYHADRLVQELSR